MYLKMLDDTQKQDDTPAAGKLDALFFQSRNVIVTGEINDKLAQKTVAHLLALAEASDDPINIFISSPGAPIYKRGFAGLSSSEKLSIGVVPIRQLLSSFLITACSR